MEAKLFSKKGIVITTIIHAIIALVVVGIGAWVTTSLLFGEETNLVRVMLGLGNISAFDKGIVERYNVTQQMNVDAINSVDALLYATNSLAVFDTHPDERKKPKDYSEYERDFGQAKIKYTLKDSRIIYPSGTKEEIKRIIVKNIIACEKIFKDKVYDNSKCFAIDTSKFGDVEITSEDIKEEFDNYYNDSECDQKCKNYIFDLAGYYGYNPLNWVFNPTNWDWDSGLVLKKGIPEVGICGDNAAVNEIHITTSKENCPTPPNSLTFGFAIEDFNLPQKISYSESAFVYGVEQWLNAYGDPEYILYYEKFPEGEEEYWKAGAYNIAVGTILTVEGIFLLIDVGTFGIFKLGRWVLAPLKAVLVPPLGRLIKLTINPLLKAAKGGISRLTPRLLRTTYSGMKKGLSGVLKALKTAKKLLAKAAAYPFRKLMARQLTKEMAEEAVVRTARKTVEGVLKRRLGIKAFNELSEEMIERITQQYIRAFKNTKIFLTESGEELIEKITKKLTKNARSILDGEFDMLFKEIDISSAVESSKKVWKAAGYDEATINSLRRNLEKNLKNQNALVRKLKNQIGEDGLEKILFSMKNDVAEVTGEAALRTPTRMIVQRYKSAARASDRLRATIAVDLTKEERQEVIEKILKEGVSALDNMNPRDASKFIIHTDTQRVVNGIFKNGDIVLDIAGKKFTAAQKAAATEAFDEAVKDLAIYETVKPAIMIERSFGAMTSWLNPIQKKRHIVAVAAAIAAIKIESMNAKFVSSGTNAFGLKRPYASPIDYDEMEHVKNEKQREDFFEHFGKPGYQGMIPEANRYWMSLTRDRSWWWFSQEPTRFHLVSPCKADILMRVSTCTCIGTPIPDTVGTSESWIKALFENQGVYETGKRDNQLLEQYPNIYPNGIQEHFDKTDSYEGNPSLFTLDENGYPIKQCNPSGKWFTFGEEPYPVKCIKFDPILDESTDPNYCYHGLSPGMDIAYVGLNFGFPIGLAIAGTASCVPPPLTPVAPICGALGGAIGGATGALTYAWLNTDHQWPHHS